VVKVFMRVSLCVGDQAAASRRAGPPQFDRIESKFAAKVILLRACRRDAAL
jgi:hypothetical protein